MNYEEIKPLLLQENFFTTAIDGRGEEQLLVIGKKGRCYTNRYTVYDIRMTDIDGNLKITYESVIKSFKSLRDAIIFQFKALEEYQKLKRVEDKK